MRRYSNTFAVIGAGPAGLLTSFFIRNHEVLIFEEHDRVGIPEHCTGLIGVNTAKFYTRLLGWKIIDAKYWGMFFHTPHGTYKLVFDKPVAYHVNRPFLEEKLLDKVLGIGHKVFLGNRVKPLSKPGSFRASNRSFLVEKIIASDGALSIFKKYYLGRKPERLYGIQMLIRSRGLDTDYFHVLYDAWLPDFFQWIVPLDHDLALAGYAVFKHRYDPDYIIDKMFKRLGVLRGTRIKVFGGVIPVEKPMPKPGLDGKIFFVGDSLPLTKPYTGGGLYGISIYAPLLGVLLDNDLLELVPKIYGIVRSRFVLEDVVTRLFRRIGYWIPAYIVSAIHRLGLLRIEDYDRHGSLILKSMPLIPFIWLRFILEAFLHGSESG